MVQLVAYKTHNLVTRFESVNASFLLMSKPQGNLNLKNRSIKWDELFMDYYSGMSNREIERKYDLSPRQIQRQCRRIMIRYIREGGRFEKPVMENVFVKCLDYNLDRLL